MLVRLVSQLRSPKLFSRCEIPSKVWSCTTNCTKTVFVDHCGLLDWIWLFDHKLSSRWRGKSLSVLHSNSLQYSNDLRGKLNWNWLSFYLKSYIEKHTITCHYSAEQQTAKRTLTTSKNSIEFTFSNFPCHLNVNRDKLQLTVYESVKRAKDWR